MKVGRTRTIAAQGMLAAIYVVLSISTQPISFGPVQCRVAEALTVLPFLEPLCTVGLAVGCLLANLLGGAGILDIVFGTLATVLAGLLSSKMPKSWLAPLPPVVLNGLIVGAVLTTVSVTAENFFPTFWLYAGEVALGELAACGILGLPLLKVVGRTGLFPKTKGTKAVKRKKSPL